MFVELEKPFAWPKEPESFEEWDKKTFEAAKEDQEEAQKVLDPATKKKPTPERGSFKEQADAMLAGEEEWKPTKWAGWEDVGEPIEVDAGVELPKN